MAAAAVLVRLPLCWLLPLLAFCLGQSPNIWILLLSMLSSIWEIIYIAKNCQQPTHSKVKPARRSVAFQLVQFGSLYSMQVLLLTMQSRVWLPPQEMLEIQKPARIEPSSPPSPAISHRAQPVESVAASKAPLGTLGFELDAPPDALRWSPKTISVVLPCAEEREYAVKTVKSVFENTPSDVLREIVVVDDGSNPPIAQKYLTPEVQRQYKVKVLRHERTVGLIGAKKTGGDAALGDIIVFFDCHVAPQPHWHEDFLRLIAENYRRMVVPQITALNIDSWTQIGRGGGMSKCYVTWDGDFKWGGTSDMYMGMLSGGLAGLSRRWWWESGGFDDKMLGWGGENIDQGIRMWVCGGEIVAAPNAQVAHMWRTGTSATNARYHHVGDTTMNRARAIAAWAGEFSEKMYDYPVFASRRTSGGPQWFGSLDTFQKVKDRLQGCRPFAWYLRRFKTVYEDAGIVPVEIFMLKEKSSGKCLRYQGHAGTSPQGRERVVLDNCDSQNHRFFWHLGNRHRRSGKCCSGLRAWNTDQCLQGAEGTYICEISGAIAMQEWALSHDGRLVHKTHTGKVCLGSGGVFGHLSQKSCDTFVGDNGRFTKESAREPLETQLYNKAQKDNPELFRKLNAQLAANEVPANVPAACLSNGKCRVLKMPDNSNRCLDEDGLLATDASLCVVVQVTDTGALKRANGDCLDTWSDNDQETWGFYGCHGGPNQRFEDKGGHLCAVAGYGCLSVAPWSAK
eukprot:TRINITY_DN17631_c0_g1_i1.p1 TRINITY_DN17631_c0_g1~~TRINITY_DN17631_c0_g1_i1.p1  ORF type:complete len:736 (-),score=41.86 TRINITY_DN17631_c0_g1_i1:250-2457(-)